MTLSGSTDFDSGGSCTLSIDDANNHVEITADDEGSYGPNGYFHFRLSGTSGEDVSFEITNLEEHDRIPDDYRLLFTSDLPNRDWTRMDESISGGVSQTFESDEVYISNMHAYPYGHISDRVSQLEADYPDLVETEVIGQSVEGRDIDVIRVSDPDVPDADKQDILLMTRQHPGEVQGSYHMDAIIDCVLDVFESNTRSFSDDFTFHCIPCANPDGVHDGYHRDVRGYNWNREWSGTAVDEIELMKDYMRNNLSDIYWAFDLHSSTNSNYNGATTYYTDAPDSDDLDTIDSIASHSMSLSGTADIVGDGWAMGWLYDEFGAVGVVTEVWTYYDYNISDFEVEGEGFVNEVMIQPQPSATKHIREDGDWILVNQS